MLSGSASGQPPIDCDGASCTVAGPIADNVTFEAGNTYLLHGQVVVEEPAVLTIEAGTLIHGSSDPAGALVISQGAQIRANGTAEAPTTPYPARTTPRSRSRASAAGRKWTT